MGRDRVRCVALLYCLVSSRRAERLEALKAIGEEGMDRHKLIAMIVAALMPQELAEKKRAMADGRDNINGTSMMREGEFGRVNAANTGRSYGFDKAADAIQWLMPSLAKAASAASEHEREAFELLDWHLTHQPSMRLRYYALEALIALKDKNGEVKRRCLALCSELLAAGKVTPGVDPRVDARASYRSPAYLALVYLASCVPTGYGMKGGNPVIGGNAEGTGNSGGDDDDVNALLKGTVVEATSTMSVEAAAKRAHDIVIAALNESNGDISSISKNLLVALGAKLPGGRVLDDVYRVCNAMIATEADFDEEGWSDMDIWAHDAMCKVLNRTAKQVKAFPTLQQADYVERFSSLLAKYLRALRSRNGTLWDGIKVRLMGTIARFGEASSPMVTSELVIELSDDSPAIVRSAASTLEKVTNVRKATEFICAAVRKDDTHTDRRGNEMGWWCLKNEKRQKPTMLRSN